jgi:hypothetical protein
VREATSIGEALGIESRRNDLWLARTASIDHSCPMNISLRLAQALALSCILSFTACGGDDDEPVPTDAGGRDLGADASRPDSGGGDLGVVEDGGARDGAVPDVDAGSVDAGGRDAGPPPDCRPQDARGEGACDAIVGVFFRGTSCVFESGCSCVGADCADGFDSIEACEAAYPGCIRGIGCKAITCGPGSNCIDCPRGGICVAPGTGCP